MVIIRKELNIEVSYDLSRLGDPEKLLFFDIETTGLSAYSSSLYLIGCIYLQNGRWQFVQWLAENMTDELPLLRAFNALLQDFDTFVHFNGDTFDIPYLKTTASHYGYPNSFEQIGSIDILKLVRKKKRFFGLPSLRQKALEAFLGIQRDDLYSGGELIGVYHQYEKTKDERLKGLLLLHNEDDLKGMLKILPILNYCDLLDEPKLNVTESYASASGNSFTVHAETQDYFPSPITYDTLEGTHIELHQKKILFRIPCVLGELKYYYPNYRDYYYLPAEDTAVHKKVASFVDPVFRRPATRETCYTRISGMFLPALMRDSAPVFKNAWNEKKCYLRIDETSLPAYLKDTLKTI